jgi:hypothetical protein
VRNKAPTLLAAILAIVGVIALTASPAQAAGTQKWGTWFKISNWHVTCRNYVSINTGSRMKFRAYTQCKDYKVKPLIAVSVSTPKGGHSRACSGAVSCDSVKYVNNRKGIQTWCGAATSAIDGQASPDKADVRVCIKY